MTPISFGPHLGYLHDAPGDVGVLMCGAPGFEQLCAQKGWRELGDLFAARGYPTLRFDWHGCGDSLGRDDDPGRLAAWEDSLVEALAFARAHLRPRQIILVGLRFGATLAADIAARAGGVDGMVLLGPAVAGRLYGRELAGLASVMAPLAPDTTNDGLPIAGFRASGETLEAMKALDLRKLAKAPAAQALLFAPQGQMGVDELVSHWRGLGCDMKSRPFVGYAEWLAEPTFSQVPRAIFDEAVEWVAARFDPRPAAPRPTRSAPATISGGSFIETTIRFGPSQSLNGVLCEPRGRARETVATIFVNAGANPRMGWARMNVDGARQLASDGYASLRIDVAGLGDSAPAAERSEQVMYDLAPRADVSAAIDALLRAGYQRVVIVGLCSGGHIAFHTAVADPRVEGVVMVNLQKFIWRDDYSLAVAVRQAYRSTGSYQRGALKLETYKRLMRGEIDARGITREMGRRALRIAAAKWRGVARRVREGDDETSRVRRWFKALSDRGTRVLLVYSVDDGGIDELALHFGSGGKGLRNMPGVAIQMIENADHNLTQRAARIALFGHLEQFLWSLKTPEQRLAESDFGDPNAAIAEPMIQAAE